MKLRRHASSKWRSKSTWLRSRLRSRSRRRGLEYSSPSLRHHLNLAKRFASIEKQRKIRIKIKLKKTKKRIKTRKLPELSKMKAQALSFKIALPSTQETSQPWINQSQLSHSKQGTKLPRYLALSASMKKQTYPMGHRRHTP